MLSRQNYLRHLMEEKGCQPAFISAETVIYDILCTSFNCSCGPDSQKHFEEKWAENWPNLHQKAIRSNENAQISLMQGNPARQVSVSKNPRLLCHDLFEIVSNGLDHYNSSNLNYNMVSHFLLYLTRGLQAGTKWFQNR